MIQITEQFAASPEKLWPFISDPRRWPEWLAVDGPWLAPETVMPIAADGSEWLAAAGDGQQAIWSIAKDDDTYRLHCLTTDTKHAAMPVHLLHYLRIIPIDGGCEIEWATDYDLIKLSFWQRLLMRGPVRQAIETMQIYSLINLHSLTADVSNDDHDNQEEYPPDFEE